MHPSTDLLWRRKRVLVHISLDVLQDNLRMSTSLHTSLPQEALLRGQRAFGQLVSGKVQFARQPDDRPRSSKAVDLAVTGISTDAIGLMKGKVRAAKSGQRAICRKPDFYLPIVRPGRRMTADHRTTISFRIQSQSKTAKRRSKGSKWSPAHHGSYIERSDALPSPFATNAVSDHTASTHYIERDSAMVHLENETSFAPLSNIGDTPEERRRFWKAVDLFETEGNPSRCTIDMGLAWDMAHAIALDVDCPAPLRVAIWGAKKDHAITVTGQDREVLRHLLERHGCRPPPKPAKGKAAKTLTQGEGPDDRPTFDEVGFDFVDGRAGVTQIQANGELPYELSLRGKQRALARIHKLFTDRHLPIVSVIHEPDYNNDDRNWHFHLAAYDRPCARFENKAEWLTRPGGHNLSARCRKLAKSAIGHPDLEAWEGRWDFEVPVKYSRGSEERISTPFWQVKDRDVNAKGFPKWLRQQVVDILNDELNAEGHVRRYDARTYELMGIDKEADQHLDKRASQLEKCGIPTKVGTANEERQWAASVAELDFEAKSKRVNAWLLHEKVKWLASATDEGGSALAEAKRHSERAIDAERAATELALLIERARSRAVATDLHCTRVLQAIETGKATTRETADRALYEARQLEARQHLLHVQQYFAEQQADIAALKAQSLADRRKADRLYTVVYDDMFTPKTTSAIEEHRAPLANKPTRNTVDAAIPGIELDRPNRVAKRPAFEREMLLHVIRRERLEVTRKNGLMLVGEHPDLLPEYRQHIGVMTPDLLRVRDEVNEELGALRRHILSGKPDSPLMSFLKEKRPDIVAELAPARASLMHQQAAAATARQQGNWLS